MLAVFDRRELLALEPREVLVLDASHFVGKMEINVENQNVLIQGDVPDNVKFTLSGGALHMTGSVGMGAVISVSNILERGAPKPVCVRIDGTIHPKTEVRAFGRARVNGKEMIVVCPQARTRDCSPEAFKALLCARDAQDRPYYENRMLFKQLLPMGQNEMFYAVGEAIPSSPVIDAIKNGHMGYLEDLINGGADLSFERNNGETALSVALQMGNKQAIELLLDAITRGRRSTPLSDALRVQAQKGGCEEYFLQLMASKGLRFIEAMEVDGGSLGVGFTGMLWHYMANFTVASVNNPYKSCAPKP